MDLSIVIPTTGDLDILGPTLDKVKSATQGIEVEIFVVDDSAKGALELGDESITTLKSGGRGASFARNKGWRQAKSNLILFLDDDILIDKSHITRTLELHRESSAVGYNFAWLYPLELRSKMTSSKIGKYMESKQMYSIEHRLKRPLNTLPDMMKETGLSSQYFSIEKKWMDKVGGYDAIPFAGVEDSLLFKKLDEVGVSIFLSTRDIVEQNESKRIDLGRLLTRYRSGALTRRVAVQMGHQELGVNMTPIQKIKGLIGMLFLPFLKGLAKGLPYGWLYRRTVAWLLFTSTYLGFYRDPLPADFSDQLDQAPRKGSGSKE